MAKTTGVRIQVRITPNARRNEIAGLKDGVLHVKIAAPPVEGRANETLIDFLSDILRIGKSNMTILKGLSRRTKLVAIATGLTREQIMEHLEPIGKGR